MCLPFAVRDGVSNGRVQRAQDTLCGLKGLPSDVSGNHGAPEVTGSALNT